MYNIQKSLSNPTKNKNEARVVYSNLSEKAHNVLEFFLQAAITLKHIYFSQTTIGKKLGYCRSSVNAAIKELRDLGLILVLNNNYQTCDYALNPKILSPGWHQELWHWFKRYPPMIVSLALLVSPSTLLLSRSIKSPLFKRVTMGQKATYSRWSNYKQGYAGQESPKREHSRDSYVQGVYRTLKKEHEERESKKKTAAQLLEEIEIHKKDIELRRASNQLPWIIAWAEKKLSLLEHEYASLIQNFHPVASLKGDKEILEGVVNEKDISDPWKRCADTAETFVQRERL